MHNDLKWNYSPYKPLLFDSGDIYISRIVPGTNSVHLEWINQFLSRKYDVFYKKSGADDFIYWGYSEVGECDIDCLLPDTDYEFYVCLGELKSRIRLARTGGIVGTVVNYLHPRDNTYSFSGNYLCSPSIVRHPDGCLLSSMDVFGHGSPQNLTLIFKSDNNGVTWKYQSELMPCFWAKMFIHNDELYILACSTEYGDLIIGKSNDAGKSFSEYSVLLRGSGKIEIPGIHKNPQNIVKYRGRIYATLEWGCWAQKYFAPMVMSCDEKSNLLDADNWSFTEPVKYNPSWEGTVDGPSAGNIEGTLVIAPDGKLLNIMRYDTASATPNYGKVIAYEVNTEDPTAALKFSGVISFPANLSKFTIKYDNETGMYFTIANRITDPDIVLDRRLLSLMISKDLKEWTVLTDLHDFRSCDPQKIAMQYADFIIEEKDIIYICRTAMNNADSFHDSNYQTFHRLKDFRRLIK